MPSTSAAQAKLMSAIAHGWRPAHPYHKLPPLSVAREFHEADKRKGVYMHPEHKASGGAVLDAIRALGELIEKHGLTPDEATYVAAPRPAGTRPPLRQGVDNNEDWLINIALGKEPPPAPIKSPLQPGFLLKRQAFGEGGAVGRLLDLVAKYVGKFPGMRNNSKGYLQLLHEHGWNPRVSKSDFEAFDELARAPAAFMKDHDAIDRLFDKYSLSLDRPIITYRGLSVKDPSKVVAVGTDLRTVHPQSSSTEHGIARDFANRFGAIDPYDSNGYKGVMLHISNAPGSTILPVPTARQSELLLPAADRTPQLKVTRTLSPTSAEVSHLGYPSTADLDAAVVGYASGGSVESDENKSEKAINLITHALDRVTSIPGSLGWMLNGGPSNQHLIARAAQGALSMAAGQDAQGRPQFGKTPRIWKMIEGIPATATDLEEAAIGLAAPALRRVADSGMVPLPLNVTAKIASEYGPLLQRLRQQYGHGQDHDLAPQWSQKANDEAEAIGNAVDIHSWLGKPTTGLQRAAESVGTMIPLGESSMLEALGPARFAVETMAPVIRTKPLDYAIMGGLSALPDANARGDH